MNDGRGIFYFKRYTNRALAVTLPIGLVAALWFVIIAPIQARLAANYTQSEAWGRRIAAEGKLTAETPALHAVLRYLQYQGDHITGPLGGRTQALATEELQNDIQQIIIDAGGQVISVSPMMPTQASIYEMLSMQVSFLMPSSSMSNFLRDFDRHVPNLFMQSASFQPTGGQLDDMAAEPSVLAVNCTIDGYWRPDKQS